MNSVMLSPVDYLFTGPGSQPITFAFYYHDNLDLKGLQDSLKRSLEYFPLLRSQLIQISETDYQYSLQVNELLFEIHKTDSAFQDSDDIEKYITPVSSSPGQSLTRITLTRTSQGSVLAVSISHALVDGFSYFHFLSSWARICRGENFIQPVFDRKLFLPHSATITKSIGPQQIYDYTGLFYLDHTRPAQPTHSQQEKMFISDTQIRAIMEKLKKESEESFTANDVLTALIWQKYLPYWTRRTDNLDIFITCPFDFRRVLADFPKYYFGCALCFATAKLDLQSLQKASLVELALLIRNSVNQIKKDYILNSLLILENLRRQKGLAAVENIHLRHPEAGMIITNLSRLPITDLNFGTGAPTSIITYAEVTKSAAILPATGGVEVMVVHPVL